MRGDQSRYRSGRALGYRKIWAAPEGEGDVIVVYSQLDISYSFLYILT